MKTFLTLLAAITSLSAYTLVGVHAKMKCAICPKSVDNSLWLFYGCTSSGVTTCQYKIGSTDQFINCRYDPSKGTVNQGSDAGCPKTLPTGTGNSCECIV